MLLNTLLLTLLAYLLGSLPFGVWVGRLFIKRDIREGGSGHSGATNTLRQAGWKAGVLVALLDLTKGFVAEWLALQYGLNSVTHVLAGTAVVAGHCWPLLARFRGGMGLGPAGGVLFAIYPLGVALGLGLIILPMFILRHTARASVVAGLFFGPTLWFVTRSATLTWLGVAIGAVVAVRFFSDWGRKYREMWLDRENSQPSSVNSDSVTDN